MLPSGRGHLGQPLMVSSKFGCLGVDSGLGFRVYVVGALKLKTLNRGLRGLRLEFCGGLTGRAEREIPKGPANK